MKDFISRLFRIQDALSAEDHLRSRRLLIVDGVCSMGMGAVAGGPFLAAFALAIGASNYEVGMLTTIALASQLMQLPGLVLVNNFPRRRAITAVLAGSSRLFWILIILIPFLFGNSGASFLIQWFLIASFIGGLPGPAWNSLLRDIIPKDTLGNVFAARMMYGTVLALALTLGGGYFVDTWQTYSPGTALYAYSCLFIVGVVLGLIGVTAIARLPEPAMKGEGKTSITSLIKAPVRDKNFRCLLIFIGFWSFAVNMAGPFFVIYMLQTVKISLSLITVLTVVSQVSNIVSLRVWGSIADRFSSKSVFTVSCPLFLVSVLAWSFTTMPERYFLTIPLLLAIHVVSGVALAGVNLASSSIALKLSPDDQTHGYMTVFSLVISAAGACGPLAGGLLADFFSARELGLSLNWTDPVRHVSVYALDFKALDFVFLISFIVGLLAVRKLASVREEGEVPMDEIVSELIDQVVIPVKTISSVEGLRNLVSVSVNAILYFARRRRGAGSATAKALPDQESGRESAKPVSPGK